MMQHLASRAAAAASPVAGTRLHLSRIIFLLLVIVGKVLVLVPLTITIGYWSLLLFALDAILLSILKLRGIARNDTIDVMLLSLLLCSIIPGVLSHAIPSLLFLTIWSCTMLPLTFFISTYPILTRVASLLSFTAMSTLAFVQSIHIGLNMMTTLSFLFVIVSYWPLQRWRSQCAASLHSMYGVLCVPVFVGTTEALFYSAIDTSALSILLIVFKSVLLPFATAVLLDGIRSSAFALVALAVAWSLASDLSSMYSQPSLVRIVAPSLALLVFMQICLLLLPYCSNNRNWKWKLSFLVIMRLLAAFVQAALLLDRGLLSACEYVYALLLMAFVVLEFHRRTEASASVTMSVTTSAPAFAAFSAFSFVAALILPLNERQGLRSVEFVVFFVSKSVFGSVLAALTDAHNIFLRLSVLAHVLLHVVASFTLSYSLTGFCISFCCLLASIGFRTRRAPHDTIYTIGFGVVGVLSAMSGAGGAASGYSVVAVVDSVLIAHHSSMLLLVLLHADTRAALHVLHHRIMMGANNIKIDTDEIREVTAKIDVAESNQLNAKIDDDGTNQINPDVDVDETNEVNHEIDVDEVKKVNIKLEDDKVVDESACAEPQDFVLVEVCEPDQIIPTSPALSLHSLSRRKTLPSPSWFSLSSLPWFELSTYGQALVAALVAGELIMSRAAEETSVSLLVPKLVVMGVLGAIAVLQSSRPRSLTACIVLLLTFHIVAAFVHEPHLTASALASTLVLLAAAASLPDANDLAQTQGKAQRVLRWMLSGAALGRTVVALAMLLARLELAPLTAPQSVDVAGALCLAVFAGATATATRSATRSATNVAALALHRVLGGAAFVLLLVAGEIVRANVDISPTSQLLFVCKLVALVIAAFAFAVRQKHTQQPQLPRQQLHEQALLLALTVQLGTAATLAAFTELNRVLRWAPGALTASILANTALYTRAWTQSHRALLPRVAPALMVAAVARFAVVLLIEAISLPLATALDLVLVAILLPLLVLQQHLGPQASAYYELIENKHGIEDEKEDEQAHPGLGWPVYTFSAVELLVLLFIALQIELAFPSLASISTTATAVALSITKGVLLSAHIALRVQRGHLRVSNACLLAALSGLSVLATFTTLSTLFSGILTSSLALLASAAHALVPHTPSRVLLYHIGVARLVLAAIVAAAAVDELAQTLGIVSTAVLGALLSGVVLTRLSSTSARVQLQLPQWSRVFFGCVGVVFLLVATEISALQPRLSSDVLVLTKGALIVALGIALVSKRRSSAVSVAAASGVVGTYLAYSIVADLTHLDAATSGLLSGLCIYVAALACTSSTERLRLPSGHVLALLLLLLALALGRLTGAAIVFALEVPAAAVVLVFADLLLLGSATAHLLLLLSGDGRADATLLLVLQWARTVLQAAGAFASWAASELAWVSSSAMPLPPLLALMALLVLHAWFERRWAPFMLTLLLLQVTARATTGALPLYVGALLVSFGGFSTAALARSTVVLALTAARLLVAAVILAASNAFSALLIVRLYASIVLGLALLLRSHFSLALGFMVLVLELVSNEAILLSSLSTTPSTTLLLAAVLVVHALMAFVAHYRLGLERRRVLISLALIWTASISSALLEASMVVAGLESCFVLACVALLLARADGTDPSRTEHCVWAILLARELALAPQTLLLRLPFAACVGSLALLPLTGRLVLRRPSASTLDAPLVSASLALTMVACEFAWVSPAFIVRSSGAALLALLGLLGVYNLFLGVLTPVCLVRPERILGLVLGTLLLLGACLEPLPSSGLGVALSVSYAFIGFTSSWSASSRKTSSATALWAASSARAIVCSMSAMAQVGTAVALDALLAFCVAVALLSKPRSILALVLMALGTSELLVPAGRDMSTAGLCALGVKAAALLASFSMPLCRSSLAWLAAATWALPASALDAAPGWIAGLVSAPILLLADATVLAAVRAVVEFVQLFLLLPLAVAAHVAACATLAASLCLRRSLLEKAAVSAPVRALVALLLPVVLCVTVDLLAFNAPDPDLQANKATLIVLIVLKLALLFANAALYCSSHTAKRAPAIVFTAAFATYSLYIDVQYERSVVVLTVLPLMFGAALVSVFGSGKEYGICRRVMKVLLVLRMLWSVLWSVFVSILVLLDGFYVSDLLLLLLLSGVLLSQLDSVWRSTSALVALGVLLILWLLSEISWYLPALFASSDYVLLLVFKQLALLAAGAAAFFLRQRHSAVQLAFSFTFAIFMLLGDIIPPASSWVTGFAVLPSMILGSLMLLELGHRRSFDLMSGLVTVRAAGAIVALTMSRNVNVVLLVCVGLALLALAVIWNRFRTSAATHFLNLLGSAPPPQPLAMSLQPHLSQHSHTPPSHPPREAPAHEQPELSDKDTERLDSEKQRKPVPHPEQPVIH